MRHKHIIGTAAVALGILLGATACTDSTPATAKPARAAKASSSAKAAKAADAADAKKAKEAQSVLTSSTDPNYLESASGSLGVPTGNEDASIKAGTRVVVEFACIGTGSVTVRLTSGDAYDKHEVSQKVTCSEGGTSNHSVAYRLTAKGLTVTIDSSEGAKGGYAYDVLKA
ncbi:hypothetical protein ACFXJ5_01315 [Streptomyces sp. NPDC059373]